MESKDDAIPCKESANCPSLALNTGLGLAFLALLMLMSAGVGYRLDLWHFRTGFAILKYAAYVGVAALLATVVSVIIAIRKKNNLRLISVLIAGTMAITSVAVPLSWKRTAGRLPRIHDISTDLENPPLFVAILPLRQGAANPVEYGGAEIAAQQKAAYPEVKPMVLDESASKAFAMALEAAHRLCWEIVAEAPTEGRIEAIDTSFWFGFKDDIVVRVTPLGNRSQVDVRSLSRVGVSDAGANARRIEDFFRLLSTSSR